MKALSPLILASGKTTSYSNCLSVGASAAAYPNSSSSMFIPFYRAPSDANKTTKSDCNREHTWPDSRGGNLFETDPIMVRPTLKKDNSARGNNFYGLGSSEWDPGCLGYEAARGESARIILYCATAYYDKGVALSNNPKDSTSSNTMGTLKTLLAWNKTYQPSEFEKTVNDRYDALGYRRNPFVDHPEWADYIWNDDGIIPGGDTEWHDVVTDMDSYDKKTFAIASEDPQNRGSYYMMSDTPKSASLPWYITPYACQYKDGKIACDRDIVYYTFEKNGDGKYTIKTGNNYLYGYVSGTHYSICLAPNSSAVTGYSSDATDISNLWSITPSGTQMVFTTGRVYLELYNGSFCGYSKQPSVNPILFA